MHNVHFLTNLSDYSILANSACTSRLFFVLYKSCIVNKICAMQMIALDEALKLMRQTDKFCRPVAFFTLAGVHTCKANLYFLPPQILRFNHIPMVNLMAKGHINNGSYRNLSTIGFAYVHQHGFVKTSIQLNAASPYHCIFLHQIVNVSQIGIRKFYIIILVKTG